MIFFGRWRRQKRLGINLSIRFVACLSSFLLTLKSWPQSLIKCIKHDIVYFLLILFVRFHKIMSKSDSIGGLPNVFYIYEEYRWPWPWPWLVTVQRTVWYRRTGWRVASTSLNNANLNGFQYSQGEPLLRRIRQIAEAIEQIIIRTSLPIWILWKQ